MNKEKEFDNGTFDSGHDGLGSDGLISELPNHIDRSPYPDLGIKKPSRFTLGDFLKPALDEISELKKEVDHLRQEINSISGRVSKQLLEIEEFQSEIVDIFRTLSGIKKK